MWHVKHRPLLSAEPDVTVEYFKTLVKAIKGVPKSCINGGLPRVLHDFDNQREERPYIQWQVIKDYMCFILIVLIR